MLFRSIKRAEKSRTSTFDGIPLGMPALARAQKVISKARRAGLPIDVAPPGAAHGPSGADDPQGALGRQLLALVLDAETGGLDAEAALRAAVRELEVTARQMEPPPV